MYTTVMSPAAASIPCNGVTALVGVTELEPRSPRFATSARVPTTTSVPLVRAMGSAPWFFSSTIPALAASRARARRLGLRPLQD